VQLADKTGNYSGAEIEGVVKAATAYAFNRHIDFEHPAETINAAEIKVTQEDFDRGVADVPPAFGQAKNECETIMRNGIIDYGPVWKSIVKQCEQFIQSLRQSNKLHAMSVLLEGVAGCGKSSVAAHMAMLSQFPYVKVLSADTLVGYGEVQKSNIFRKTFEDAYKSKLSVIILDDIERLLEYSHLGSRYSNILLQALLVLIKRPPPEGKKLLVIGTTSTLETMELLEITQCFSITMTIPGVASTSIPTIMNALGTSFRNPKDFEQLLPSLPTTIPVKKLILISEMATEVDDAGRFVTLDGMQDALQSAGVMK
jgi:vesicle-fusing ATPase